MHMFFPHRLEVSPLAGQAETLTRVQPNTIIGSEGNRCCCNTALLLLADGRKGFLQEDADNFSASFFNQVNSAVFSAMLLRISLP